MCLRVSSAAHSPLIQTVDELFMTHISPPIPKKVKPTYNPPAPTIQRIYNPLLIIYVPSLTNWLLWGIGASRIQYRRNQQIAFITEHLKIEMLPRYFVAYSRRLLKHASWGMLNKTRGGSNAKGQVLCRDSAGEARAAQNSRSKSPTPKSSTRWDTRSEGVGWNWVFLEQLIAIGVYKAACAYQTKWTMRLQE
jgi:hypothetical protein